ncbi:hypothetical protein QC281_41005, partial [Streptomyces sp. DH17]|nr:hypothetical protein [Streptomyces sp. DH17]
FYTLFHDVASKGAAGVGLGADSRPSTSVHDGVVKLALQVLRDAEQDTNSLDQVKENLGDTWNFAGGTEDGVPFSDKVVIHVDNIVAGLRDQMEQLNGGPAQKFGVREINAAVAEAVATDLVDAGIGFTNAAMTTIVGGTRNEIRDGTKALSSDWKVLVVQAGADGGAIVYDAKHADDASASHVIIGGTGADDIKGSSANDYLVGGEGNNKFESGGGSDVII